MSSLSPAALGMFVPHQGKECAVDENQGNKRQVYIYTAVFSLLVIFLQYEHFFDEVIRAVFN